MNDGLQFGLGVGTGMSIAVDYSSPQGNPSGLHPLGRCVLVEPYDPETKKSAIVLPPSVQGTAYQLETRARVVEIGPVCWPDEPPRCKVGDVVMISKMAGMLVVGVKDGRQYRAVNDRDIFLGIDVEGEGS